MEHGDNRRLEIMQARMVRRTIDLLTSSPSPSRAIAALAARWNDPSATAFERYAGMSLRDAGSALLGQLPPSKPVQLIPPSEGQLARLASTAELNAGQRHTLITIENALNRLICIADAIDDAPTGPLAQDKRIGISSRGIEYLPNRAGYRTAQVALPPIGPTEQAPIGYFNELDWRILDHVASIGHTVFQNSILPNMNQTILGAYAPDGSDWDVRTRMASIVEKLELPLRTDCRYDCDTERQAVSVRFTIPAASAFPRYKAGPTFSTLDEAGDAIEAAQTAYAMRCACLLGAACFGSGKHIEHAVVTADDPTGRFPIMNWSFDRQQFVMSVLPAIDSGALAEPSLRYDPDAILDLIGLEQLRYRRHSDSREIEPLDDGMGRQRIAVHADGRALNDAARTVFYATRICDIDTSHYHGPHGNAIDDALLDAQESILPAIARLESTVSMFEQEDDLADDEPGARPLYCDQPLSRAMMPLLDDQLSLVEQAEAFLNSTEADASAASAKTRCYRAPSALFHAHMGLSDLYERLGDYRGAEAEADSCIRLAPTTIRAHFRKADVLAQQGRYEEAANIILNALRFSISERDCSLLYYHLALILWNLNRKNDAAAVYVYTAFLKGDYAEKATQTIAGLRKRADRPVILFASPLAAAREMSRAGIPVAPSDAARSLVAKAAISLVNSHAPLAAAPYAQALAHYLRDDKTIQATCRSIIEGTNLPGRP